MKQELRLFRGLPGSGKTTAAKKWRISSSGAPCCLYAADDFFENSTYDFDIRLLDVAHAQCLFRAYKCLAVGHSVGVHNTFTTLKEMFPYIYMAEKLGVPVKVIHCTGQWESIHKVPDYTINAMRARWEPYEGEEEI